MRKQKRFEPGDLVRVNLRPLRPGCRANIVVVPSLDDNGPHYALTGTIVMLVSSSHTATWSYTKGDAVCVFVPEYGLGYVYRDEIEPL